MEECCLPLQGPDHTCPDVSLGFLAAVHSVGRRTGEAGWHADTCQEAENTMPLLGPRQVGRQVARCAMFRIQARALSELF